MIDIFYLEQGTIRRAGVEKLPSLKGKPLWVDITDITREDAALMRKIFGLHPLTEEDLHSARTRIKVEIFPSYLFFVFYGLRRQQELGEELVQVEYDIVLGKNFLVSTHSLPCPGVDEMKSNPGKLAGLLGSGPDMLMHHLLDKEVDYFFPVLDELDDHIELLEDEVTAKYTRAQLAQILRLKSAIVAVKRMMFQEREKVSFLAKNEYPFIRKESMPYFRDVYDHMILASEMVDNQRDIISHSFDVYMSAVSNSMNEVMKTLSVMATIALPLTVLGGIYGTNFVNLPGSASPFGFWVMIGGMLAISVGMLGYFRWRGWF
ncbi:magnesium/cobalt transporter CorA [Candidatus Woesearchaeota archaeon]|nr:magnesium/cobalt transporter CorA [Candidatus Woesearchaeota archaeon]